MIRIIIVLALFFGFSAFAGAAEITDKPQPHGGVDFAHDVRPILSDKCFHCHGPDKGHRKAKLRLDLRDVAIKREAFVAGNADDSEMIYRIETDDPDERMPPPESHLSLTAAEKGILREWIVAGAEYQQHWAFTPIEEHSVSAPSEEWGENFIDHYVLKKLQQNGRAPLPQARRETLLRRVTFDLTGLPPTQAQLEAFMADASTNAYERVVDRLLASSAYGERMATEWMDVARYADTYGFQVDRDRHVWPWRDWVINAFNRNLSYRDFIVWQVAGDCLPEPTHEQVLATTFNRLHQQKVEGGSVEEEFRVEYVADRTHTFGTAFLGLTMECARCHDHKFDPISQRDYYRMFAYFNNVDESGLYSYFTPSIPTPAAYDRPESGDTARQANARVVAHEDALSKIVEDARESYSQWQAPTNFSLESRIAHYPFDEASSGTHANTVDTKSPATTSKANTSIGGKQGRALRLTGDDAVKTKVGNFERYSPFSLALWINPAEVMQRAVILRRSKAWTDAGSRGYEMLLREGRAQFSLIHFWPGNAISIAANQAVSTNTWTHIGVSYDGSSRAAGMRIYINGRLAPTTVVRDHLTKNIGGGGEPHIALGERFRDNGFKNGGVDDLQVFNKELSPPEMAQVAGVAARDEGGLFETFLRTSHAPYQAQYEVLSKARKARSDAVEGLREIMVMKEMPVRRKTYLLERGQYDRLGDEVSPGVPDVLPALPDDGVNNRLTLAKWLVDPKHPLTSRVAVNRYWQMFFGRGLVGTSENFGSQAEPPTHPKLLDALAGHFISTDWDLKGLCKTIALSATYRQSSIASPSLLKEDPENRLLARGPSHRLSAEMIRDQALAVSGLLVDTVGGGSVKPYEVSLSFKPVKHDSGAGLYRRSLYTYWRLTAPAPAMMTFNAAKRSVCTVKRENLSSPLQALILMNSPQFVEAARVVATKSLNAHGDDMNAVVADIFGRLIGRDIQDDERKVLTRLYDEQLSHFKQAPDDAAAFLKNGLANVATERPAHEVAAAGVLASALFSYDECLMKR